MAAALERGVSPPKLDHFEAVPGRGVRAMFANDAVLVGNMAFLAEQGVSISSAEARVRALEEKGRTVVIVARAAKIVGLLAFGYALRTNVARTIGTLRRTGMRTIVMSGDNKAAVERVAKEIGLDEVHAQLLPPQKAALIRALQRNAKVAMVGDGINDSVALMQADVGIAMGDGADIAIDSADIIILNNRLDAVLEAYEISRWSYRKMLQNVCLAIAFNGIGIPLAATGLVYPIWAMAAMAFSVTTIFSNSLRGRPRLFFDAILSVGRVAEPANT